MSSVISFNITLTTIQVTSYVKGTGHVRKYGDELQSHWQSIQEETLLKGLSNSVFT